MLLQLCPAVLMLAWSEFRRVGAATEKAPGIASLFVSTLGTNVDIELDELSFIGLSEGQTKHDIRGLCSVCYPQTTYLSMP